MHFIILLVVMLALSGCTSYGLIENAPLETGADSAGSYSITAHANLNDDPEKQISVALAFSGGGSRAAAFSYGVLEGLKQIRIQVDGGERRLLDVVDVISSVSGGSFTAAYYGLHGEKLFENFREDFLQRDVESELISKLQDPFRLFSSKTRTELAVEYFDQIMFHGATFSSMLNKDNPLIIINASDLGDGVRLSFTQEYFNLLCSDLASFPVSRAVTASSAVPLIFSPVVIRNYPGCINGKPQWLAEAERRLKGDSELMLVIEGLQSYLDKDKRKYIHLVDGGVTDNLGLRSLYEIMELSGGARSFMQAVGKQAPRRIVVIVVDASTRMESQMHGSPAEPSLEETVNALTDAQLHRYNAATLKLMEQKLAAWSKELSTQYYNVEPYFVYLRFKDLQNQQQIKFINQIPTGLSLSEEQLETLIEAGAKLLHDNPEIQRLIRDVSQNSGLN